MVETSHHVVPDSVLDDQQAMTLEDRLAFVKMTPDQFYNLGTGKNLEKAQVNSHSKIKDGKPFTLEHSVRQQLSSYHSEDLFMLFDEAKQRYGLEKPLRFATPSEGIRLLLVGERKEVINGASKTYGALWIRLPKGAKIFDNPLEVLYLLEHPLFSGQLSDKRYRNKYDQPDMGLVQNGHYIINDVVEFKAARKKRMQDADDFAMIRAAAIERDATLVDADNNVDIERLLEIINGTAKPAEQIEAEISEVSD